MNGFWKYLLGRFRHDSSLPPGTRRQERIVDYSIVELASRFRSGELTCEHVTQVYLERIEQLNGKLDSYADNGGYNAFVRIDHDAALQQARDADAWIADPNDPRGRAPLLCGMPMGVKDSFAIIGQESKNGTPSFSGNFALRDATAVARLRAQGAVIFGHTHCSRYSGSTDGDYGTNAWDPQRVPGGSSSGSAIAPVARLCVATLGEETSGSIMIPAAANGASAIKPSLGWVSTAGVMPLTMGWDVVGPMARSVQDASLVLTAIQGIDQAGDPQTLDAPIPSVALPVFARPGPTPLAGLTIGLPQTDWMNTPSNEYLAPATTYDSDYRAALLRFKDELAALGANVIDFEGPNMMLMENRIYHGALEVTVIDDLVSVSPIMATTHPLNYEADYWNAVAAFAENLPEAQREDLLFHYDPGNGHLVAEKMAVSFRQLGEHLRREQMALWQAALDKESIDFMLVLPLGSHVGYRFSQSVPPEEQGIQNARLFPDLPNALGWPTVTFPIGHGDTGVTTPLPINAAFWGPRFSEAVLIQAAIDYQQHYPEHHARAPIDAPLRVARPEASDVWPVTRKNSTNPLIREGSELIRSRPPTAQDPRHEP